MRSIAVAGKGGVGKTTVAAMIIKFLIDNDLGTILAIDADPSSNLHMVLGMELDWTIGDIRENVLEQVQASLTVGGAATGLVQNMTKHDYLDYKIRTSVVEGDYVDLIAMGRSEGPGCYCAINHHLRQVIDAIGGAYDFVVMDNEAGLEHLSRRTTRDVDAMIVVSDLTQRGLVAAERIAELRKELDINIKSAYLALNRVPGDHVPDPIMETVNRLDLVYLGTVPHDDKLVEFEFSGKPLIELGDDSPVYRSVARMTERILDEMGVIY